MLHDASLSMSDADHRDSDHPENRKRELISQEAAEWFARMQDPRVSLDERRRFLRWLKHSPVHVAEYLTVAEIDGDLRRPQLSSMPGAGALPMSSNCSRTMRAIRPRS